MYRDRFGRFCSKPVNCEEDDQLGLFDKLPENLGTPTRGVKGFSKSNTTDLICRNTKYTLGKYHHVDGDIVICRSGMHFCTNALDVLGYYSPGSSVYACVDGYKQIERDRRDPHADKYLAYDSKVATSDLYVYPDVMSPGAFAEAICTELSKDANDPVFPIRHVRRKLKYVSLDVATRFEDEQEVLFICSINSQASCAISHDAHGYIGSRANFMMSHYSDVGITLASRSVCDLDDRGLLSVCCGTASISRAWIAVATRGNSIAIGQRISVVANTGSVAIITRDDGIAIAPGQFSAIELHGLHCIGVTASGAIKTTGSGCVVIIQRYADIGHGSHNYLHRGTMLIIMRPIGKRNIVLIAGEDMEPDNPKTNLYYGWTILDAIKRKQKK